MCGVFGVFLKKEREREREGGVKKGQREREREEEETGEEGGEKKNKRGKTRKTRKTRKTQKLEKLESSKLTAAVALVPARVAVPALRARPLHEPVRQKGPRRLRVELLDGLFLQQARRVQLREQRLCDRRLLPGRRPPEPVAGDAKPLVDRGVHGVVLVAQRRAAEPLLDGLGLGRGAVLVLARVFFFRFFFNIGESQFWLGGSFSFSRCSSSSSAARKNQRRAGLKAPPLLKKETKKQRKNESEKVTMEGGKKNVFTHRAAHEEGHVPLQPREPRERVRRQHAADDVPQVRHVVHVGERRGDQDVFAARERQRGRGRKERVAGRRGREARPASALALGGFDGFRELRAARDDHFEVRRGREVASAAPEREQGAGDRDVRERRRRAAAQETRRRRRRAPLFEPRQRFRQNGLPVLPLRLASQRSRDGRAQRGLLPLEPVFVERGRGGWGQGGAG